ncbi:FKBP-type peptidyl-prolyl cis-trans isomerase [Sphingosinicella terrae]|uniref:FKBP-type peptidyl-prolyl cis-trans isomerase n=1 Tax=Sphingosinicella terrae TaxID=2172047 RepID=UPI000E0DEFE7|nr:FKBP-type peptidyl-prolyl cis-trans isomerase [Sphingosinicella terrae]
MSVTAVPIRPLRRGSVLKLWIGLLVLSLAAAGLAWIGTAGQQVATTASGLRYQVVQEGEGPTITAADLVLLHYTGRLENGTVFDSSEQRGGQPMVASVGNIIPGFAEGLQMMQKGGRYRLWIPPELGYGDRVPPGAPFGPTDTLIFDIEILEIAPGMAAMQNMMGPGGGAPGAAPPEGMGPPEGAGPPQGAGPPPGAAPASEDATGAPPAPTGNSQ